MSRPRILVLAFVLLGIAAGFMWMNREQGKDDIIHKLVFDAVTRTHFRPRALDDAFSEQAFKGFFNDFDGTKRLVLQSELDQFKTYQTQLDDLFKAGDLNFFNQVMPVMERSVERAQAICFDLLNQPIDLNAGGEVETDPDQLGWPVSEADLRSRWADYLRFRVVSRVHDALEEQQKAVEKQDTTVKVKSIEVLEKEARQREREIHEEYFNNLKDMERVEFLGVYLNAMANQYDPHTSYFAPREREDFEISMTGQLEGIGAQLVQKNEYIKIDNLVSGGPAWKQGELEAGDAIIKVAQEGQEAIDVVGMPMRRAIRYIRGKKGTKVTLTVKKADGSRKEITIERDVVEIESTFAKSAIIQRGGEKWGLIRLPVFYVDFYSSNNHNAARDVKRELELLKAEGVKGVILDLRGNGGGSLAAVVEMVGLFIPKGPVVQVKSADGSIQQLADEDPSVTWSGPLVVMVNEFSASASEIFAAAIQDYGRGLVVGSKQTYGKGTVQNMMDFDRAVSYRLNTYKPLGSIKLTHQKFYRISGETTQLQGVFSDVVMPDAWSEIEVGERELPTALAIDQIPAAKFKKVGLKMDKARNKAAERVKSDPGFQLAGRYAMAMKENQQQSRVPLSLEAYTAYQKVQAEKAKEFKQVGRTTDSLQVAPLGGVWPEDEAKRKEMKQWHKNLAADLYLGEAARILADLQ